MIEFIIIILIVSSIFITYYNIKFNNVDNKIWIVLVSIYIILSVLYLLTKTYSVDKNNWKIDYLNKVYPLKKNNISNIIFDDLEFIFTDILPDYVKNKYKKNSYKAEYPGPSCQQRPCKCILTSTGEKIADVQFDPDPIWDGQWPPCVFGNIFNQYGTAGLFNWTGNKQTISNEVSPPCCSTVENAQKCISVMNNIEKVDPNCKDFKPGYSHVCNQLGNQRWGAYDVWGGIESSNNYNPPEYGQLWKPTLHPDFTAVISKYKKDAWWEFYNKNGDPDNSWVEVIHTFFPSEEQGGSSGAWFYRAKGSGIHMNMGKTFFGINKFHVLVKLLGATIKNNEVIIDEDAGLVKMVDYLLSPIKEGGSAVMDAVNYWGGNLVPLVLSEVVWKMYIGRLSGITTRDKLKALVKLVYDPLSLPNMKQSDISFLYVINRLSNTGGLDKKITDTYIEYQKLFKSLGQINQVRTIQFTIQPNIYQGWTTEILYIGDNYPEKPISNIKDIPTSNLQVFGDNNKSQNCDFNYPLRYLYCNSLKNTWLNPKIKAIDDVTTNEYSECSGN